MQFKISKALISLCDIFIINTRITVLIMMNQLPDNDNWYCKNTNLFMNVKIYSDAN